MTDLTSLAKPIVWRRGYQARLSMEDREDLLQEVIVKYLAAFPDSPPDNPDAWFETATRNLLIDRARAGERRPAEIADDDAGEADDLATFFRTWRESRATSYGAIKQEIVAEVLALLADDNRDIFEQKYLHGQSSAQIAERLGIAVNTVDQRAGRARRRLRDALADRPDLVAELAKPHPRAY